MKAYRCGHSGKYLPPDYVKEWGKKYGIGLGKDPVSECVDVSYGENPPRLDARIRSMEQIQHPTTPTFAQVDLVEVTEEEYAANRLWTRHEDPRGERRAAIITANQEAHPLSKVRMLKTAYMQQKGIL